MTEHRRDARPAASSFIGACRAIKVISLSRNFGKDVALSAGFDFACGAAVIPIDADLQDPPS